MSNIKFPYDKKLFENKKFTREVLTRTLKDIIKFKDKFYGFIQIDRPDDTCYFLFFLKSRCYAAGVLSNSRPRSISISEFFNHIFSSPENLLSISLYEIDPILLKGMLVFIQREPTIKAETNLIDMESILEKIGKDETNAFVVLKEKDMMNFFFFKNGKARMAYFADIDFELDKTAAIAENFLSYAYPTEKKVIEALIYRDIKTSAVEDAESFVLKDIIKMLQEPEKDKLLDKTDDVQERLYVEISVVEGPQTGENFNVTLPCVFGRKGSDIKIKDQKVSKKHARVKEIGNKIIIEDLKSTNGTFVNNERIIALELQSGDLISIGDTKMRISFYWDTDE
jgi:hypothetical protein